MISIFGNSLEHLLSELMRIDLLISEQVKYFRSERRNDSDLRGLYITDSAIDEILSKTIDIPEPNLSNSDAREKERQLAHALQQKAKQSSDRGVTLRLDLITNLFGLHPLDRDILLICLGQCLRFQKNSCRRENFLGVYLWYLLLDIFCGLFDGKTIDAGGKFSVRQLIQSKTGDFLKTEVICRFGAFANQA